MSKFVQRLLRESVRDSIRRSVPWYLRGLGLSELAFGDATLELEDVAVHGVDQVCDKTGPVRDLKVTALIDWDAGMDMSLKSRLANLILERVAIQGRLVIYLKRILPRPPFFTGLRIYFSEPPPSVSLRLTLEAMGQSLGAAWLEKLLGEAIRDALIAQLMLPNVARILLDINDAEAWFQVGRVLPDGVLHVHVERASGLPPGRLELPFGLTSPSSDPYCVFAIGGTRWRTSTKSRTLNPEWSAREGAHRLLVQSLADQLLEVQVFHEDWLRGDALLGGQTVQVQDLVSRGNMEIDLQGEGTQGTVQLWAEYSPLVLDEELARLQVAGRRLGAPSKDEHIGAPAFVVFVGVDSCLLPEAVEDALVAGRFRCEVECDGVKEVLKSRAARSRGYYGAGWGELPEDQETAHTESGTADRSDADELENAPTASCEVNFQATATRLLEGDPRNAVVQLSVICGLFDVVGSAELDVSQLVYAPQSTRRVSLPLGDSSSNSPRLTVLAQLRVTQPGPGGPVTPALEAAREAARS